MHKTWNDCPKSLGEEYEISRKSFKKLYKLISKTTKVLVVFDNLGKLNRV